MKRLARLLFVCVASGCASRAPSGAPVSPEAPSSSPARAPDPHEAAAAPAGIPMSCASSGDVCVPDAGFVKRLCDGAFPDVALVLFSKDAPFTRIYLKGDLDGWNAEGGASARAKLRFDEEVLVLRRRKASPNGIVVGAGGGYLVMRWDGNCYTVEEGEVTTKRPSAPRHAPLPFRFYSERTKDALLESPKVLEAYKRRGRECKGAMSGEVTRACEEADRALSLAIVSEVRAGRTVPTPEKLP